MERTVYSIFVLRTASAMDNYELQRLDDSDQSSVFIERPTNVNKHDT